MRIKNGYVVNNANINKVQKIYKKPIEYISEQIKRNMCSKVKSLYVRGSVAAGISRSNFSDMDMVCILHEQPTKKDLIRGAKTCIAIEHKYPFIKDMDLTIISYNDIVTGDAWNNLRNNLMTQSFCLSGEDIRKKLPRKRVGKELCEYLYGNIENHLKRMIEYIKEKDQKFVYIGRKRKLKFVCRWIMRTILRSSGGIVMLSKPFYSPDVKECMKNFIKLYPEYNTDMHQILEWEYFPISNRKKITIFLDEFLPKYMKFFKKKISQ